MADLAGSMKARVSSPSLNPWSSSPFAAMQASAQPSTTAAKASAGEVHESDVVPEASAHKLGWVEGVLIPCLLNIWGVIMFMRLGWVAGQAGIWYGVLIIVAANAVTLVTALSMCAIATNGEVKAGGAYFMISRALGPTYGGSIGIIFYAANAVASALFVTGFSEALIDIIRKQCVVVEFLLLPLLCRKITPSVTKELYASTHTRANEQRSDPLHRIVVLGHCCHRSGNVRVPRRVRALLRRGRLCADAKGLDACHLCRTNLDYGWLFLPRIHE